MKRLITLFSLSTIICTAMTISFLQINCNRDNPFDINSSNFTPGKKPHVAFVDSIISGYFLDTVNITITWADTALGGKNGAVNKFIIDWDGYGDFWDSLCDIETDTLKLSKVFNPRSNLIRIKAIDFENDTSATDSAWLEIKQSTPAIISINAPATIEKGASFTIDLNSTDIGGVISSYHWAVDESTFSRITDTNSLTLSFDQIGDKTIVVKARDNKKIESAQRVISIRVIDPSDTVGPEIAFLSPLNTDTARTSDCIISLQVTDASGISSVTLNDTIAMQLVGLTWRCTINLNQGENILTAIAIDTKGHKSTTKIQVFYTQANIDRTPPVVLLLSPAHWTDTVNTESLILKLLARDESGVAEIFLDSTKMSFDSIDSSYSTIKILREGLNNFIVRSADRKDNTRQDTLLVVWTKDIIDTTVNPRNWPPTLYSPGNQTINENQKLQLTLNATDLNNDSLEFSFGSIFPNGALLDSNRFSWTPTLSNAGVYKLVFVVRERNRTPSLCDSQIINITVNNVNQKPVLSNPGTISGVVNKALTYSLSATDPDNDTLTFFMANAPSGSELNANKFSWTPSFSNAGTYYVKFITNDRLLSDTITVAVRINNANGTPVLTNPGNKTIIENQLIEFTLAASDPNSDSLIFSVSSSPSGSTLNGRLFSWRPNYTQAGTYTIKFYVRDNVLPPLTDSQTITIVVNNINAPPVLTSPGNKTINENARLAFDLTATDIDSNTLTYGMANAPQGAALATKSFTWTPTFTQSGTYKITFYVADNTAATLRDSQTITIVVNNSNRPPVFTDSTTKSINENAMISFQLQAFDPDATPVSYFSTNLPVGATITPTGQFAWTPSYTQAGSYRISFIARDSSSAQAILNDTASITINITNVNRPPVFIDSTSRTGVETQTLNFQLQSNDPDANPLRYISTNLPTGATLSLAGAFSWKPQIWDAGTYNIRFIVRDSSVATAVLSDTATIKITISNTNPGLPVLVSPTDNALSQPKSVTFKWSRSQHASGYFLQVARDNGFTSLFLQDSTLTDTVKTVSGLANGTTYYWKVNALNSGGKSGWTAQRSLRIIASFALSITASNGSVTTTPTPGPFDSASVVSLAAAPATGYYFDKWSGDASGNVTPTSITFNAPKSVVAIFTPLSYQLTVSTVPNAGGTIATPIGTFPMAVNHGAATSISASSNPGYNFVNWTIVSGSATIANQTALNTTVTLTSGNATIQANFTITTSLLTVQSSEGGSITAPTSSPVIVNYGTPTTITASANPGYTFLNWTVLSGTASFGATTSISTTVTLTMNAVVQANFSANSP